VASAVSACFTLPVHTSKVTSVAHNLLQLNIHFSRGDYSTTEGGIQKKLNVGAFDAHTCFPVMKGWFQAIKWSKAAK
jgi:hypothetical protein